MEDIKRRMEFNNTAIQTQAVWKLYGDVKKNRPDGKVISPSTPQYLELKTLWEFSCSAHIVAARTCCQALLQLVYEGEAEFNYILNGFLNLAPSAKNLQGLVEGVSGLLKLQVQLMERDGRSYVCPFGIRTSPHPFVTILTNRPAHAWPHLAEEVTSFFSDSRVNKNAVAALGPFIKFVLLEPSRSEQYRPLRDFLQRALCNLGYKKSSGPDVRRSVTEFIVKILPAIQVFTVDSLTNTIHWCEDILLMMTSCTESVSSAAENLVTFALSLCQKCLEFGVGISSLCYQVLTLGEAVPEVLRGDIKMAIVSQLLLQVHEADVPVLLKIVLKILQTNEKLCSLVAGMALLPALQILARPKSAEVKTSYKKMTPLVSEVMVRLETYTTSSDELNVPTDTRTPQITPEAYELNTYVLLAKRFSKDQATLRLWLKNLQGHLDQSKTVSRSLIALIVAILAMTNETDLCMTAVDRLVDIAKVDQAQAACLLPVFLYTLGRKTNPRMKLYLIEAIPKLATHKICVGPVLKTIQSFSLSQKLKPLSVRLLTELWKKQDRCFPQLLAAVTESKSVTSTLTSVVDDLTLSKAAAIRDVCKLRPEQHGGDMLKPLSDLLDQCTDDKGAPAAALALEALYYLCEAEVIDIMSAWSVLDNKLSKETRPIVVEKICDLFSLVPQLEVRSEAYETFHAEIVRRLWLYTQTDSPGVCTAAYQALSAFSVSNFKISHFRYQIVSDFVQQAQTIAQQQEGQGQEVTVDDVFNFVPGVCFTKLLNQMPDNILEGYEAFLCSMLGKEVENLPRGIYYSSVRQKGSAANQGRALGAIPAFCLSQYEKTKQPGLRPGLAASLLFSYDPPLEVGRDGRPRRHYVLTYGKNYQQMFSTLLAEVPVQPSEWHRSMLIPQAWMSYTERLFTAMLESRKTEIDLQLSRDYIDERESEAMKEAAWLWVRETLVDTIKGASRGNPTMQSNCIMALAGLALCLHRYATGLEAEGQRSDTDLTEYKSHAHWLNIVIESLMSIVDFQYPTKSSLLGLCQQRTVEDRLPASILAQAAAFLALSQMVPILITVNMDLIYHILTMVMSRLPGKPEADSAPAALQTNLGLGLGILLARLTEECFTDVSGKKGKLAFMTSLDALEECCLSDAENRSGSLLGLGLAISALCKEGKTDSRVHVSVMQGKLLEKFKSIQMSSLEYQAMAVCVGCVSGSAFTCNILDVERVNSMLGHLKAVHEEHPEGTGVCLSLGMLCYSLSKAGHATVWKLRQELYAKWIGNIADQETAPTVRLAALNGLFGMVGSERTLIPAQGETTIAASDVSIDRVIDIASKAVNAGSDIGFQGNAAWMLGHLYQAACSVSESRTSVPQSYSYLPESSLLRAVVDFLLDAGKTGPEMMSSKQVHVALTSLMDDVKQPLPPVNWAGILSPLMRLNFGEDVTNQCLELAIRQCVTSPTAAMFLSSWLVPPLFNTLQESSKAVLCKSTPSVLKAVSATVLQTFLDKGCKNMFTVRNKNQQTCLNFLIGLHGALSIQDPPEAVCKILYQTTAELFHILKEETDTELLVALSACMSCLPDSVFDQLTNCDCVDRLTIERGTFVRCYAVGNGHQPVALLNSCIDAAFNNAECDKASLLSILLHCFHKQTTVKAETNSALQRLQWLLEILGHVKNIVTGSEQIFSNPSDNQTTTQFAVNIISGAINVWTKPSLASLLGLKGNMLELPEPSVDCHNSSQQNSGKMSSAVEATVVWPIEILSGFVTGLGKEPWNQILPKVIDWLLAMSQAGGSVSEDIQHYLKDALLSMRGSQDFNKVAVWTRTFMKIV